MFRGFLQGHNAPVYRVKSVGVISHLFAEQSLLAHFFVGANVKLEWLFELYFY